MGCLYQLVPKGSGNNMEEGEERMQGSQNGEGSCELPSSGHGMDVVLMSSLKLWLSTEGKVNSISQHQLASTGSCRLHEEKGGSVKEVPNVMGVPRKSVRGELRNMIKIHYLQV